MRMKMPLGGEDGKQHQAREGVQVDETSDNKKRTTDAAKRA